MTDVMLAFANARTGREAPFDAWYTDEHTPAVLAVDGIVGARRFEAAVDLPDGPEHPYGFLAIYDVETGEIPATVDRLLADLPPMSSDAAGTPLSWWFEELGARVVAPEAGDGPFDQMVVLTNANPGTDAAFNRWYDETHIPDVLGTIGGYVGAHRFRRAQVACNDNCPWGYMALYDMPKGAAAHCFERIRWSRAERDDALAAGRAPQVPIDPAMGEERLAWFYRETVPYVGAEPAPVG